MAEYKNIVPVYNALGGEIIDNLPILDLKIRRGCTDYIDFIRYDEMPYNIILENRIKLLMDNIEINDIIYNNDIDDKTFWLHGNGNYIITLK